MTVHHYNGVIKNTETNRCIQRNTGRKTEKKNCQREGEFKLIKLIKMKLQRITTKTFGCPVYRACVSACLRQNKPTRCKPSPRHVENERKKEKRQNNSEIQGSERKTKRRGCKARKQHDRGESFPVGPDVPEQRLFWSLRKSTCHSLYMHVCVCVCALLFQQ